MAIGGRAGYSLPAYVLSLSHSGSVPADARSLARMHLGEINERIAKLFEDSAAEVEPTSRAHLLDCQQFIAKVLAAGYQAGAF
jgi:hypothetical protein